MSLQPAVLGQRPFNDMFYGFMGVVESCYFWLWLSFPCPLASLLEALRMCVPFWRWCYWCRLCTFWNWTMIQSQHCLKGIWKDLQSWSSTQDQNVLSMFLRPLLRTPLQVGVGSNPAGRDPLRLVLCPVYGREQLDAGVLQLVVDDHMVEELPVLTLDLTRRFLRLLKVLILVEEQEHQKKYFCPIKLKCDIKDYCNTRNVSNSLLLLTHV